MEFLMLKEYETRLPQLHLSCPLSYHWCYGWFSPGTGADMDLGPFHERIFVNDIDNVAHNRAKIDALCAFYFAATHNKGFNDLAHRHLKQLERQSQNLYASQMEENLCTSLLQSHDRAKLLQETQNAARRLQLALSRVRRGDQQLPPWGPPLLPGDREVEQVKEWTFPIPWTVIAGKDPNLYIRVATATAQDPCVRSIEGPLDDAAKQGVLPLTAVFWGLKQSHAAPATVACEAIARAVGRAKGGAVPPRTTPRGTAQAGGAGTGSASSSTARVGASQAVAAARGAARTSGPTATSASARAAGLDPSLVIAAPGNTLQLSMPHARATPGASAGGFARSTAETLGSKGRMDTSPASAAQRSTGRTANQHTPSTIMKSTETFEAVPPLATAALRSSAQTSASPAPRALGSTTRSSTPVKAASDNTARGYTTPDGERSASPALSNSPRACLPRQQQDLKEKTSQSKSPNIIRAR